MSVGERKWTGKLPVDLHLDDEQSSSCRVLQLQSLLSRVLIGTSSEDLIFPTSNKHLNVSNEHCNVTNLSADVRPAALRELHERAIANFPQHLKRCCVARGEFSQHNSIRKHRSSRFENVFLTNSLTTNVNELNFSTNKTKQEEGKRSKAGPTLKLC